MICSKDRLERIPHIWQKLCFSIVKFSEMFSIVYSRFGIVSFSCDAIKVDCVWRDIFFTKENNLHCFATYLGYLLYSEIVTLTETCHSLC